MLGATEERLNVGNSLGYPPKAAGSIPAPASRAKAHQILGGIFTTEMTIATMLTEAGTNMTAMMQLVWTLATANPLLTLATSTGIGLMGFGIFRLIKRSVR